MLFLLILSLSPCPLITSLIIHFECMLILFLNYWTNIIINIWMTHYSAFLFKENICYCMVNSNFKLNTIVPIFLSIQISPMIRMRLFYYNEYFMVLELDCCHLHSNIWIRCFCLTVSFLKQNYVNYFSVFLLLYGISKAC